MCLAIPGKILEINEQQTICSEKIKQTLQNTYQFEKKQLIATKQLEENKKLLIEKQNIYISLNQR